MDIDKHWGNLDNCYDLLLEAQEADMLLTEQIEEEILSDKALFAKWAMRYATESVDNPLLLGFMPWATDKIKRERTSAHTHAWENERKEK